MIKPRLQIIFRFSSKFFLWVIILLFGSCSSDDFNNNLKGNWTLQSWKVNCEMEDAIEYEADSGGCISFETVDTTNATVITITKTSCMELIFNDNNDGFLISGTPASLDSTPITYTAIKESNYLEICMSEDVCLDYFYNGEMISLEVPTVTIELEECRGQFTYVK